MVPNCIEFNQFEKSHKFCKFTKSEIDLIKDNIETSVILGRKTDVELNNGMYGMYYSDKSFNSHHIEKFEDEWYTVHSRDYAGKEIYYICDQFDELISLLKKLK